LAENASLAQTTLARMKGLLGKKELLRGEALILKPCNSIHMFFMRFSIDVVFVDKNNKVIRAISTIKPFQISNIYWRSVLAIELPAGTIQSSPTSPGDTLVFQ